MDKFRKLPCVVEAVRFDPEGAHKDRLPSGVYRTPNGGFKLELAFQDDWPIKHGKWIVYLAGGGRDCEEDRGDGLAPEGYEPLKPALTLWCVFNQDADPQLSMIHPTREECQAAITAADPHGLWEGFTIRQLRAEVVEE